MQEGGDVLLWPGSGKGSHVESRGAGGVAEEAHRHLRGASMEERCQCKRHHPPVCGRFLSWVFRLKKLCLPQMLLDYFYLNV